MDRDRCSPLVRVGDRKAEPLAGYYKPASGRYSSEAKKGRNACFLVILVLKKQKGSCVRKKINVSL